MSQPPSDWRSAPDWLKPLMVELLVALDSHLEHVQSFVRARIAKNDADAEAASKRADESYPVVWQRLGAVPMSSETSPWVGGFSNLVATHMGWPLIRDYPTPKTEDEHQGAYQLRQSLARGRAIVGDALHEWRNPAPIPPPFERHEPVSEAPRPEVI